MLIRTTHNVQLKLMGTNVLDNKMSYDEERG